MLSKNVVVSWALELELLKSRLKEDAPHNGNMFEECGVPETATSVSYCGGQSENGDASSAQADDDSLELEEYQDFIFVAINNNRLTKASMFLGFSPMSRSSLFVEPSLSTIPSKQGVESSNNYGRGIAQQRPCHLQAIDVKPPMTNMMSMMTSSMSTNGPSWSKQTWSKPTNLRRKLLTGCGKEILKTKPSKYRIHLPVALPLAQL
jgi:hypothetical protein